MSVGKVCLSLKSRLSDELMHLEHRLRSLCLAPLGVDLHQSDLAHHVLTVLFGSHAVLFSSSA
jgi:hypothetical protein